MNARNRVYYNERKQAVIKEKISWLLHCTAKLIWWFSKWTLKMDGFRRLSRVHIGRIAYSKTSLSHTSLMVTELTSSQPLDQNGFLAMYFTFKKSPSSPLALATKSTSMVLSDVALLCGHCPDSPVSACLRSLEWLSDSVRHESLSWYKCIFQV